jgi:hypothetical protein
MGSKSKQTNQSSQSDARSVADNGALAVGGSSNVINITDGGLIEKGVELLKAGDAANSDRLSLMLDGAGQVLAANTRLIQSDQDKFMALLESKKQTDTPASQELASSLGKTVIYGAVALVAVMVVARGAK